MDPGVPKVASVAARFEAMDRLHKVLCRASLEVKIANQTSRGVLGALRIVDSIRSLATSLAT